MENIIIFGGENSGKNVVALNIIKPFSPSNLKYKRKIELEINGENYYFNISDIHFEIDFELLGTNENAIWIEFINHVSSIIETKQIKGIIFCKNIHTMKDELLNIFYTFIRNKNITFVFTTKHVSYLPNTLKSKCKIINLKQTQPDYSKQHIIYCDQLIDFIKEKNSDLFLLRELLYSLLTYNCDIHVCLHYIYDALLKCKYIQEKDIDKTSKEIIDIIKKYNTNYRPIYHLESFILYLHTYN
uniref:DNA polymerase III delta N-terminal domain-containing protein n=1 Tax=viral metagenome TaxID=1070528 RepID=A0A6C0EUW9_9ZZZZ